MGVDLALRCWYCKKPLGFFADATPSMFGQPMTGLKTRYVPAHERCWRDWGPCSDTGFQNIPNRKARLEKLRAELNGQFPTET